MKRQRGVVVEGREEGTRYEGAEGPGRLQGPAPPALRPRRPWAEGRAAAPVAVWDTA